MVSMPNVQQINSLCHITNMHICRQYIHARQVMPFNWERLRTHPVICFYPFRVWCFLCVFFIFNHLHIFIYRKRETLHFFTSKFEHTSCDIIMIINGRLSPEYHKYKHKHFTWLSIQIVQLFIKTKDAAPQPKVLFFPFSAHNRYRDRWIIGGIFISTAGDFFGK